VRAALVRTFATLAVALLAVLGVAAAGAAPALAAPVAAGAVETSPVRQASLSTGLAATPNGPTAPKGPTAPSSGDAGTSVKIDFGNITGKKPSSTILVILGFTVLAVAPALLLLCTSFTKMIVVLSLTRNALGLQSVPPNQVLAGLALFLSLFVMAPVLSQVNSQGVQPYLKGEKTQAVAFQDGVEPLKKFMLSHTRKDELALMVKMSNQDKPKDQKDVSLSTLVPAFVLSELKSAFIIGFVVFVPFLVIDIIVSASLMSMGMMMLPPVMISLPFKLLLFVMVDGWGLIVTSLVTSYR